VDYRRFFVLRVWTICSPLPSPLRSPFLTSPLVSSPSPSPPPPQNSSSFLPTRCVVLPGVVLRRGSVLGSGSLAPEDFDMSVGSVWVSHLYCYVWNLRCRSLENEVKELFCVFRSNLCTFCFFVLAFSL
jgi:hypothetical protein